MNEMGCQFNPKALSLCRYVKEIHTKYQRLSIEKLPDQKIHQRFRIAELHVTEENTRE